MIPPCLFTLLLNLKGRVLFDENGTRIISSAIFRQYRIKGRLEARLEFTSVDAFRYVIDNLYGYFFQREK